jgi:aryl-alcohol dehydrogenase-like predicted oxidoreductase
MRYVEVGGVQVSAIGLGTWQFGSREWGYGDTYTNQTAFDITRRALDLGINLIDTAEIYGFGRSERVVGEAIRERRSDAFVATKVFPIAAVAPVVEQRGRASRNRLGIDAIDLYQVHWPNPVVPLASTMAGMRRLQDAGVVRHVGVSNFSLARWRRAEDAMGSPVLSNQVCFNLAQRGPLRDLVPYAADRGRLVIAYSPLAQGLLGGRYDLHNRPAGLARDGNALFLPENLRRAQELIDTLREVAHRNDATPAQVALAWVIRRPNVVAIPGASSVEQLEHNAAAADLDLSAADDEALTAAAERFQPRTGVAAVPGLAANLPRQVTKRLPTRSG